jgi:hypothetical protein
VALCANHWKAHGITEDHYEDWQKSSFRPALRIVSISSSLSVQNIGKQIKLSMNDIGHSFATVIDERVSMADREWAAESPSTRLQRSRPVRRIWKARHMSWLLLPKDGAGSFRSHLEMARCFDRRRFDVLAAVYSATGSVLHCPTFDRSHPLMLYHMNLHTRNPLVNTKGRFWFINWANAGAYFIDTSFMRFLKRVT